MTFNDLKRTFVTNAFYTFYLADSFYRTTYYAGRY